jgi:formate dehydrogenase iron-sulfur subunit
MADATHENLASYLDEVRGHNNKGFWGNADTYMVSLLKEYWGDAATVGNDFCFDYLPRINGDHGPRAAGRRTVTHENSFYGPLADPAAEAGHLEHPPRVGFFTDTSVCIGCKACEVACKEWNAVPEDGLNLLGMSFDNTGMLGADSWRHVAFIEQDRPLGGHDAGLTDLPTGPPVSEATAGVVASALHEAPRGGGDLGTAPVDLGFPSFQLPGAATGAESRTQFRWLMSSDVCKHCTHAGCLDVCPTGALFRTEFGMVLV